METKLPPLSLVYPRGRGANSVYSGAAYDRRKGLCPPVESTGANILGVNRDLKLVGPKGILTGAADLGLLKTVGHRCCSLSGGDCNTKVNISKVPSPLTGEG